MGNIHPFLQRRGDRFFFRIQVPAALRQAVGLRELTAALRTGERSIAVPRALALAATAKRLFHDLKQSSMTPDEMTKLLEAARAKLRVDAIKEEKDAEVDEAHRHRIAERRTLQAKIDALESALAATVRASSHPALAQPPQDGRATTAKPEYQPLHALIDAHLQSYPKARKAQMFKKVQAALELLRQLIGSKPIDQLRQSDVVDYFNVVMGLPPRWAERCAKERLSPRELSRMTHEVTLSKKSFDDNYVVPVRLFINWAITNWQDRGFPTTLTTAAIEFDGDDDGGKNMQRAMTDAELEILFHGPELQAARSSEQAAHKWWLPVTAFYTGARANELAQINPQTDVLVDKPTGIHYLRITDESEGHERIKKSVKTGVARSVPLHPELIDLGFLDYVEALRKRKQKLLFPAWKPTKGRASILAERWFRGLLARVGLRDETPGSRLVGLHAFRHTLLARAANSSPPVDAGPITGHADANRSAVQRNYEGELAIANKLRRLEAIQFNFKP